MNTSMVLNEKRKSVASMVQRSLPEIQKAVVDGVDPVRLARVCQTAIMSKPDLLRCSLASLQSALMQCAAMGLEPETYPPQVHLIPRNMNGGMHATIMVDYRGFLKLAYRSELVDRVVAHVVYEGDEFEIELGERPRVTHKPGLAPGKRTPIGVYAIAHMPDGPPAVDVMTRDEVDHVRQTSASSRSKAWEKHWGEMAKKTVIRRLCKTLPLDPAFLRAINVDERTERGEETPFETTLTEDECYVSTGEVPKEFTDDVDLQGSKQADEATRAIQETGVTPDGELFSGEPMRDDEW